MRQAQPWGIGLPCGPVTVGREVKAGTSIVSGRRERREDGGGGGGGG